LRIASAPLPRQSLSGQQCNGRFFIWVAAEDETILPPGGGEPYLPGREEPKASRKSARGKNAVNSGQ